ncbi:MAG TPA: TadE/TadG family type IV pilus assembly protein [Sphingomonadales bacterium]|nr:TadE/TadG family type IV pilus assembly protein [Sphingomonadales bacterium]
MTRSLQRLACCLARDEAGSIMVELALAMTLFAVLLLGGFEVSRMATQAHEVEQFARAGAQWGMLGQADASDTASIESITQAAAGDMAGEITVTATNYCLCPDDSPVDCSEDCNGAVNQLYLQVVVTKPYDFVLNLAGFGTVTLAGRAVIRVR